ncbi:MAG: hypothetical protein JXA94_02685 [Parachlamydiales bacterium]|nr:hypothetical protein [Parachlamydiales bacterium]
MSFLVRPFGFGGAQIQSADVGIAPELQRLEKGAKEAFSQFAAKAYDDIRGLEGRVQEVQHSLDEVEAQEGGNLERIQALETENQELKRQVLEEQKKGADHEQKGADKANEEAQVKLRQMQEQLGAAQRRAEEAQRKLRQSDAHSKQELLDAQKDLERVTQLHQGIQEKALSAENEASEARRKVQEIQFRLANLQKELIIEKRRVEKLEEEKIQGAFKRARRAQRLERHLAIGMQGPGSPDGRLRAHAHHLLPAAAGGSPQKRRK